MSPKAPSAVRSNAILAALPADLRMAQLRNLLRACLTIIVLNCTPFRVFQ